MGYLLVVSLIWAFSFGLIKNSLAGVDPFFVAAARLGIALLVLLPFFRPRGLGRPLSIRLLMVGAVQYGGMYAAYTYAFHYLQAYEVALFTVFTPLYVSLYHGLIRRRLNPAYLLWAALAVAGAWLVKSGSALRPDLWAGFWIVQISNVCFAVGQVAYRRALAGRTQKDSQVFALLYLGGFAAAGLASMVFTDWHTLQIGAQQWLTLLYLGAVASGLCFFWWNAGARQVNTGTLAVFNNLKIPLAVVVSLAFFGERANPLNLAVGGGLALAALLLSEWTARRWVAEVVAAD